MSYPPCSQQHIDDLANDCQFENILSRLEQEWPIREQVAKALREANAAFAAQCTDPDGYTFTATCNELAQFLNLKIALELSEQKLLVQVLQVALAMHENAINDPVLTPAQRSNHHLATTALLPLCRCALEKSITDPDLWCHVFRLANRAEQAHTKAVDELDLSKYFDFENVQYDFFSGSEDERVANQANVARSAAPSPASASTTPKRDKPKSGSVRDATPVTGSTPRSARLKEKALAMLNPSPSRTAPLGRRHTAPTLLGSRTSAGRMYESKARPRPRALQALQEAEE